jgi:hypothetical protein
MRGKVVPFPLTVRRDFICHHAQLINDYVRQNAPECAEWYLGRQLKIQADKMKRRGIAEVLIDREVAALRRAIIGLTNLESVAS